MAERGYERRACVRRQQDSVANLAGRLHLRGKLGAVRGSCDQAAVALIGLPCYCLAWCGASGGNVAVVVGLPGIGVQRERRGRGGPRRAARGRTGGRERGAALKKKAVYKQLGALTRSPTSPRSLQVNVGEKRASRRM